MGQHYSDPSRADDKWALPDVETFQMTAEEIATSGRYEDEIHELMHEPEYRLANFNSKARAKLIDALIEQECIEGGWFYWFCLPGCMPDSEAMGPYATQAEALAAAQDNGE